MFIAATHPAFARPSLNAQNLRALHHLLDEKRSAGYRITQDEHAYSLQFDVPGIAKEQLSIGIEGSVVRIESQPDAPRSYKAAYELPQDIDVSASDARLENGVLTLKLAKKAPVSNVSNLTIN
ncbi:MAG: Hsp20/alpha crystallin family protein [Rhodoferax sp.]|uniref:Hsp20/alpha crystallin family protein n=1 Tax=Rhodoferax sp. TaxID=50421 RepID=UPI003264CE6B